MDVRTVAAAEHEKPRQFEKDFIELPKKLYAGSELWVPWFDIDMKQILRRKHPFFLHSGGEFFIVYKDGIPSGRICVVSNIRYQEQHERKCAHFFFLDAVDDAEVFGALVRAAAEWASDQGCELLEGPLLFGGVYGSGLLIKGYEHRAPMTMMAYNFPYYKNRLEDLGFSKYFDVIGARIDPGTYALPEKIMKMSEMALKRGRFKVVKYKNKRQLKAAAEEIGKMYNATLSDHPEDYPLTDLELQRVTKDLLSVATPGLVKILEYDGRIVGFLFAFSDASNALIKNRGRITLPGLIRILTELRSSRKVLINGMGILPEYQRLGGNALLYAELLRTVNEHNFTEAEIVQIAETTEMMIKDLQKLGGIITKINRIYSLDISGIIPQA